MSHHFDSPTALQDGRLRAYSSAPVHCLAELPHLPGPHSGEVPALLELFGLRPGRRQPERHVSETETNTRRSTAYPTRGDQLRSAAVPAQYDLIIVESDGAVE